MRNQTHSSSRAVPAAGHHSPKQTGLVVRSLKRVGREVTPPALLSTQAVGDPRDVLDGAAEVIGGVLFIVLAGLVFLLLWVFTSDPTCWSAF